MSTTTSRGGITSCAATNLGKWIDSHEIQPTGMRVSGDPTYGPLVLMIDDAHAEPDKAAAESARDLNAGGQPIDE